MGTLRIADADLYYRETGTGTPLLLIHGIGAHADVFDDAVAVLSRHHRVIVYDRRGYARSGSKPAPVDGYLRRQAQDAAELLQALHATPAVVIGWSLGALVALRLALDRADLVSRLVLCEPTWNMAKHMPLSCLLPFAKALLFSAMRRRQAAVETFLRMSLSRRDGTNGYDSLDGPTRARLLGNAETFLHELRTGTGEDITGDVLRELRCPVAAIVGTETHQMYLDAADRLAKVLVHMPVHRVRGGDHLLVLSRATEFASLVLQADEVPCQSPMPRSSINSMREFKPSLR